jgi:hypothetical protein
MPYFITNKSPDCSGWATTKEEGEVIGCHTTKQDAIDQMVAVSIAEDMEPGGERALPDNYRPALSSDVPKGRACGNCHYYNEDMIQEDGKELKAYCMKWDAYVLGGWYCNAWESEEHEEEEVLDDVMEDEVRQVSLEVPVYIRSAARKGLDYYGQGLAGDGLVDRTVREARDMARGDISEDKVIRTNAWGARHLVDLDAPKNSYPDDKEFPGAGAVAFYLWGINPLDPEPAMNWFMSKAEAIKAEQGRSFSFHRTRLNSSANIAPMTEQVETRRITSNDFELRADPQGNGMSFTGYAAVFNSPSEPLPFIERIAPGAFSRSLKSRNNVRMYMNHDSSMLLATTRAKTLRLSEDSKGLLVDASLPDTTIGRDLSVLMKRGDVNSMSFGFSVPSGGDVWSDDGQSRELRQIKLFEVSVVTGFPAYTATEASVRSLDALSERTGIDADQLAAAITTLESGKTLSQDHAMLLRETVAKLEPAPQIAPASVGIMAKHLDLLNKVI